jgi:hypothetical protein
MRSRSNSCSPNSSGIPAFNSPLDRVRCRSRSLPSRTSIDAEIGELWNRIQTEFHANQRTVIESLAADGALAADLDTDTGADMLWALNHPTLYHLLTTERGWTPDQYEQWLGELLALRLLKHPR